MATGAVCSWLGAGVALAAVGDLDSSFSIDGVARNSFIGGAAAHGVAVQPDGKIVAAGNTDTSGDNDPVIIRYGSSGFLDPAFDGGGISSLNDPNTLVNAVGVISTGQIFTAGQSDTVVMFVARDVPGGGTDLTYNSSGPSPGASGSFWEAVGAGANDLALRSSGSAVLAGFAKDIDTADDNFAVATVFADGTNFTKLGNGSGVDVSAAVGNAEDDDSAQAVAIDPADGDIVAAGNVDPTAADGGANDDNDIAILRFDGGALDPAFSGDGIRTVNIGGDDTAADVAIQPDGRIVVAGTTHPTGGGSQFDHFVLRLNGSGTINSSFGGPDNDGVFVQSAVSGPNLGRALAVLPDGRIVVAGETLGGFSDWVIARYTSAGEPDGSFDGDGSRTYSFASPSELATLSSLAVQPDGKLIVGGTLGPNGDPDFAVGRLLADTPPPPVLTGSVPASPANENRPRIKGIAEDLTVVRLFSGAGCIAPSVATGTAAGFLTSGFDVLVPDNSTTTFSATATNSSGTSTCSTANLSYTEVTPPAVTPPSGAGPTAGQVAPGPKGCKKGQKLKNGKCVKKKRKKKK